MITLIFIGLWIYGGGYHAPWYGWIASIAFFAFILWMETVLAG
jgi:hypothetical protein